MLLDYIFAMDMDFTENGLNSASLSDKKINEFFQNIKIYLRENQNDKALKFDENDSDINIFWNEKKKNIHQYFCDNFNTPSVVSSLLDLIKKVYEYHDKSKNSLKTHLIYGIGKYISDILKCLGLIYNTEFLEYFKFSQDNKIKNEEEILTPVIDALVNFRGEIKNICIFGNEVKKILTLCDSLRDNILPNLGIKIEDKNKGEKSIWKFFNKEEYLKEKQKEDELKNIKKKQKEEEYKERQYILSLTSKEYYAMQTDKYSEFDEIGVPIKNEKGILFSQEQYNKLKKEFGKHDKQHQKWLEQQKVKSEKEKKSD